MALSCRHWSDHADMKRRQSDQSVNVEQTMLEHDAIWAPHDLRI
jgi:hypothetical protein